MVQQELQRYTNSEISYSNPLEYYINHFDQDWRSESLPKDWYNLKKRVGFSMDLQMQLFGGADYQSILLWTEQTKQDILGFSLEYLSQGLVFPIRYEKRQRDDGSFELVDPRYNKALLDSVSSKERSGQVARSLLRIQNFFLNPKTPDGSFTIMPSPKGYTGLTTDDGKPIFYPDSYFYIMTKLGDEVRGFAIKTDFSLAEVRSAIEKLTGSRLPDNASLESYVSSIAFISPDNPWKKRVEIEDILRVLESSRENNNPFAFENRDWHEVRRDIKRGFELYSFNTKTWEIIGDFEQHAKSACHSSLELRKVLAATILRLSRHFLFEGNTVNPFEYREQRKDIINGFNPYVTFGAVLDRVEQIPGCAGGGIANDGLTSIIQSLVPKIGKTDDNSESYSFDKFGQCINCNEKKMLGPCNLCQGCDLAIQARNSSKLAR